MLTINAATHYMDPEELGFLKNLRRRLRESKSATARGTPQAIIDRFADVPELDLVVASYDFPDNAWADKPGIRLDHYSDKDLAALGRRVFPRIASEFCESGMAAVMVLAFNLKKPRTNYREYMFDQDAFPHLDDKKYDDHYHWVGNGTLVSCGTAEPIITTVRPQKEAAVYAYIAASLLRLFTKSPANYVKAWDRILDGFEKFYGDRIEIMLPIPVEAAIKSLAERFSNEDRAKVALYRILYCSNESQTHAGLKRFLYDCHLSYTGMHIVNILDDLVKLLNCSPDVILDLIKSSRREKEVESLKQLMQLREDPGATHTRKMWRYGRIFDHTFMAHLQTKRCPQLVYTLAFALQFEAPDAHKDILNIAHLGDLSEWCQLEARVEAKLMLRAIKNSVNRD